MVVPAGRFSYSIPHSLGKAAACTPEQTLDKEAHRKQYPCAFVGENDLSNSGIVNNLLGTDNTML